MMKTKRTKVIIIKAWESQQLKTHLKITIFNDVT